MPEPDFPESEFAARLDRAQRLMRDANLDALLLTTEPAVRYFSGFRTLFWQSPTRPWFLIVPLSGKPIAVIPEIGAALMARTWIEDIRTFASPAPRNEALPILAGLLKTKARIGLPMSGESQLRLPLNDFQELTHSLAGCELADATPLIQTLRHIKSEREIALIRQICLIACDAFDAVPQQIHAGMTLKDAFRAFRIDLLRRGADDVPYLVGGAGPDGYADIISPPDGTHLATGDVFMMDTGATLNGYFCDFDRNFSVGPASETAARAHATLVRATQAAFEAARPGRTFADLFQTMAKVLQDEGGQVGRMGHGLGMQLTETPSIAPFDTTVLEAGMVVTLEPGLTTINGRMMVHEENIVIREDGAEFLTRPAGPELPRIGG